MLGLGDSIYQRAFIKKMDHEVYLETPWPQLYEDLSNVKFVLPSRSLRTQDKNVTSYWVEWEVPPEICNTIRVNYRDISKSEKSIIQAMSECFDVGVPESFDLPDFTDECSWVKTLGDFALVRPVTERKEWYNTSRNPRPEYVEQSVNALREMGVTIVSVADLKDSEEWLVGKDINADFKFHAGQLTVKEMMALTQSASYVIGGVGWIVPASLAYKSNAWIILGGQGGLNSPQKLVDKFLTPALNFVEPDKYCLCSGMTHNCKKEISNYEQKFTNWLRR
jgi:hypothetical protein